MKNTFIIVALSLLTACQQAKKVNTSTDSISTNATDTAEKTKEAVNSFPKDLLGSYVGEFGSNKINLIVSGINTDSITGRSVVGGNDRPFKGTIRLENNVYLVKASEPGDDKYDGIFEFTFDPAKPEVLNGGWIPNNKDQESKKFSLNKREFVYMKDAGDFPVASNRLLTEADVENLTVYDLWVMRNEIFARHGYCFKEKKIRRVFETKDWYIPFTVSILKDLTPIEIKNIALIKRYEKYQEEAGDEYGR